MTFLVHDTSPLTAFPSVFYISIEPAYSLLAPDRNVSIESWLEISGQISYYFICSCKAFGFYTTIYIPEI